MHQLESNTETKDKDFLCFFIWLLINKLWKEKLFINTDIMREKEENTNHTANNCGSL